MEMPLLPPSGRGFSSILLVASLFAVSATLFFPDGRASGQESAVEVTFDAQPRTTSILVDNVIYLPSQLPVRFSWDMGSTHSVAIPSPSSYDGSAKRYDFVQWNDMSPSISRTITVSDDMPVKDYIAIFKTKYLLSIYSDYGSPSGAGWYEDGSTAEISIPASDAFTDTGLGTRQAFAGWNTGYTPSSLTNYVDIAGPTVVIAEWKTQFMLGISGSVASGTGAGWYDSGSIATASVPESVQFDDLEKKYTFKEWQLTSGSVKSASDRSHYSTEVLMDAPVVLSPQWNEMYYVAIDSAIGNPTGQGYYASGDTATVAIDPVYETDPGKTRYLLTGWKGAGFDSPLNSFVITVHEPVNLSPVWTKQHYIKATSTFGMVSGSGWYNEGSPADLQLQSSSIDTGFGRKAEFIGWSLGQSEITSMDKTFRFDSVRGPAEVTAVWKADDSGQMMAIGLALAAVAVTAAITMKLNFGKKASPSGQRDSTYNWRVRS